MEWINNFSSEHPMLVGIIAGIIIGFIPSIIAGHYANKYTSWRDKKSLREKQKRFIDKLSISMRSYLNTSPANENEVGERRKNVTLKVRELSKEIFKADYPIVESIRPESTNYPLIDCKWCHRPHKANSGTRGDCRNCDLPLDLWIGSQSEANESEPKPS